MVSQKETMTTLKDIDDGLTDIIKYSDDMDTALDNISHLIEMQTDTIIELLEKQNELLEKLLLDKTPNMCDNSINSIEPMEEQ